MQAGTLPVVQLIGPGGAGKTTVGRALAGLLGWPFVDLDAEFMSREGDVAECMATHGYLGYARRNLAVHREVRGAFTVPTVYALSSGFMTYPIDADSGYAQARECIERSALTVLLLPHFDLEPCVETIVQRQLARPYLRGDRASEESRIRQRFPLFMALQCERFRSDAVPLQAASQIERFVKQRIGSLPEPAMASVPPDPLLPPAPGTSA
ncbi:shikimate kinase [Variovorax sp. KBW07]|uniref:shikimate kinase n=1 Tax=Variovorax sp. KBW07 TaxID=2153358 RepID=UPI000F56CB44|nr:shikimate kinase [Variovorax sp. KBW07]RQO45075.1 shikimate kinase [Variovorax sp. KBW07]